MCPHRTVTDVARRPILITGSAGLIGTAVIARLIRQGRSVIGVDVRKGLATVTTDILDLDPAADYLRDIAGIIHLAAVSRVIDAERDPLHCAEVNVEGTRRLLESVTAAPRRPWFLYASSREIYGQQSAMPVSENADAKPMNTYAKSKWIAEGLVQAARQKGLHAAIMRFSNVYGAVQDHATRVVPAFVAQALVNAPLQIEGANHTFDFTYIDDVAEGITRLADHMDSQEYAPTPIHFVTGRPTTLGELATLTISLTASDSTLLSAPPRTFDVAHFVGDPRYAASLLRWKAEHSLEKGLSRMIAEWRQTLTKASDPNTSYGHAVKGLRHVDKADPSLIPPAKPHAVDAKA
ncbi:NAD-dependent epimerase/dehydratase family protein [Robbsia andropogonis]|uniref:NAD-dependent epimerase/dehydratase family protein n=1 Tax=Robbsia andropogonis TaxID=28092 RepID=UPI00209D21D2|nr:NAD-dependent epimerase/dehydratase family protein [Robbsia andropogonis]MCP1120322.1 NAD-dependent epimerase/dehydratase family protein [Robbsia andropogonis]MCP1130192.1 NAD-dependent epimerase/dehydratase family protein [Robbsia andropogonis]